MLTEYSDYAVLLLMVFLAVVFLAGAVIIPTFGTDAKIARKLRARVRDVIDRMDPASTSLLREQYLRELPPFARAMEQLPGMERLSMLIEQSGRTTPAYKVILTGAGIAVLAAIAVGTLTHLPLAGLLAGGIGFFLPIMKIRHERNTRIVRFEEQLPDALSIMGRSLKAGIPFVDAMRFVAEETADPMAGEFRRTFSDINYGMNIQTAYLGMLQRMPSMSLMAVVTAVMIQRDTGGNLAEILDKIAAVVRGRFKLQRRVRTLSAEGRMSAWILILVPFVLAGALFIIQPDYLPNLTKDATGRMLALVAFINSLIGVQWIRRVIRIQV
ncbi:MAG: type II secretion system F family protein [Pseudomonadota bacterium]|nr:type II secretion system F family protein [Pseudomonadota bacterium]